MIRPEFAATIATVFLASLSSPVLATILIGALVALRVDIPRESEDTRRVVMTDGGHSSSGTERYKRAAVWLGPLQAVGVGFERHEAVRPPEYRTYSGALPLSYPTLEDLPPRVGVNHNPAGSRRGIAMANRETAHSCLLRTLKHFLPQRHALRPISWGLLSTGRIPVWSIPHCLQIIATFSPLNQIHRGRLASEKQINLSLALAKASPITTGRRSETRSLIRSSRSEVTASE